MPMDSRPTMYGVRAESRTAQEMINMNSDVNVHARAAIEGILLADCRIAEEEKAVTTA